MQIGLLLLALALAFLAESFVEYFFGTPFDKVPALKPFRWLLMYIAAAVGVGMALYYKLDLLTMITGEPATWLGMVLSGLGVGQGANFINDFAKTYIPGVSRE